MGGLEAMRHGLIPFTNRGLGLSEIIEDGVNGFVITEPLLVNTQKSLEHASSLDLSTIKEIVKANLKLCDEFTWEKNIEGLNKVFELIDPSNS